MEKIVSRGPVAVTLSVVVSVLLITGLINAATTISTNITSDGTLSIAGLGTLGSASTTILSVNNTAFFGTTATTTIDGAGNVLVMGSTTLQSVTATNATSTNLTFTTATTTHTNAATSTLSVGCVQLYATSTNTKVRLEFGAFAIASASSTTFRTGAAIVSSAGTVPGGGQVLWSYGGCP